jgi:hypothetical protein
MSEDPGPDLHNPELLAIEIERLCWLTAQTMDGLADTLLGQIQTVRDVARDTQMILDDLPRASDSTTGNLRDARLARLAEEIEEVIRDLPEPLWDPFVQVCRELAQSLRRLPL